MSVILNALRSKESGQTNKRNVFPKEGLFVDSQHDEKMSSQSRIGILAAILFSATIFAVVRVGSIGYLAPPSELAAVTPKQESKVVSSAVAAVVATALIANQPGDLDAAKELLAEKKFGESLAIYERLIVTDPSNASILNDMGFILMKQSRMLEAESRLKAAVAADKKCAECFNNLGMLSTQLGRLNEAQDFLMRAIEVNPSYPDAHFNLAVMLQKSGDKIAAMAHFEDFLSLTPLKSAPVAIEVRKMLETARVEPEDDSPEKT